MLYTNADQFINKRDDLCMLISDDEPDLILLTEVIPKAQKLPIDPARLHVPGYSPYLNFVPSTPDLGRSGMRGVCVLAAAHLKVSEVIFKPSTLEQVWIKLPLRGSDSLMIGCMYRSPSNNSDENLSCLKELLQQASPMPSPGLVKVQSASPTKN